jgi:hypothetical protein
VRNAECKDWRTLEADIGVADLTVSGPGIEVDIHPLIPLILHASGEQLVVVGNQAIFSLRPPPYLSAYETVIVYAKAIG